MLRIKELLKEKKMTAKELAVKIGMTETGLSLIVKEKGNPPLNTLERIATALDVEIWELFTKSNSSNNFIAMVKSEENFYYASTLEELEDIILELKELKRTDFSRIKEKFLSVASEITTSKKNNNEKFDSLEIWESGVWSELYNPESSDLENIERFKQHGITLSVSSFKKLLKDVEVFKIKNIVNTP